MTKQEEAAKLFEPITEPEATKVDIEAGPVNAVMREALGWLHANGVSEVTFPNGMKVVFKGMPKPQVPMFVGGPIDLTGNGPKTDDEGRKVIGGYNEDILFAHVR